MHFVITTLLWVLCWISALVAVLVGLEWFYRPSVARGELHSIGQFLTSRLSEAERENRLGSAALVLIHKGEVAGEYVYGFGQAEKKSPPRRDETLYLLSSVSKAMTTWGVMKLVEDGKIGLDEPILPRMKRWRFPGSEQYRDKVTVRHLLSHTSGFVDGFGFSGFSLWEKRQTPEESLQFPRDANGGEPRPAILMFAPGSRMSYSSAGYTVLQILIEELTGRLFNEFMTAEVLRPLGIDRGTYDTEALAAQNRLWQLAPNFDTELNPHPPRKHTMMAGGSLRITPHEMALFLRAYFHEDLISKSTIGRMLEPQPGSSSTWALGHEIYVRNQEALIVGHGGGAFPRTGASFRVNPATGNAIAIMMTGGPEMIDPYMKAWTYWETGIYDFDVRDVVHNRGKQALLLSALGGIAIVGLRIRGRNKKQIRASV